MTTGRVLVVDVGTSSVRGAVVDGEARVVVEHRSPLLPDSPAPGLVEFDAARLIQTIEELTKFRKEDSETMANLIKVAKIKIE